jgi:hypothetical protein
MFDIFMKFSGVENRQQFSSVDKKALEEMDTYEKTRTLAKYYVNEEQNDRSKWQVDFKGLTSAFL